jgi:hypothetical protein
MREIVRASLPLDHGVVLDPFMGAGSTIAAAMAVGYAGIGLEKDPAYFRMASEAIPKLAQIEVNRASSHGLPLGNGDYEVNHDAHSTPKTGRFGAALIVGCSGSLHDEADQESHTESQRL